MSESFEKLFEESLGSTELRTGAIVKGTIESINNDVVLVNAGLKSEAIIPIEQFHDEHGQLEVNIGDEVDVAIDSFEDGFGETILSREKAKRAESWIYLENAHQNRESVIGVITDKVKGGFTVEIGGVRAFLPGSLVDVRPVRDTGYLEGKDLEFKVIKIDKKRNNVVVSRRSVMEDENSVERDKLLDSLQEGQELKGVVKNLTDYGAFVDLGGIDGLLHITDMSWRRVRHPSEVVNIGDEILVKILKFERERGRVSLGLKQLGDDPWADLKGRFPQGMRLRGKVTNLTDYGCFVEIEDGVEGLVHVSEMDWTNKNIHPSKVVAVGDEVDVCVLEIDEDRRRISLGIKQCMSNPWEAFAATHNKGEKITGKIKSITDFGIFIGLDGEIDGLIHMSDLAWDVPAEEAARRFKKGDEIEAIILAIDADRERVSLGLKQMSDDPFSSYAEANPKGTIVKGEVVEVDAKSALIQLADEVMGSLKASDLARTRVEDARNHLQEGQEVEAKIMSIDRKTRTISLSVKAKDVQEEKEALEQFARNNEPTSSSILGDLLKEKMETQAEEIQSEKANADPEVAESVEAVKAVEAEEKAVEEAEATEAAVHEAEAKAAEKEKAEQEAQDK